MAVSGASVNSGSLDLFVNGTLMRGLPLHHHLQGAEFLGEVRTAARYRLFSIGDEHPGMFEVTSGGVAVAGELYRLSPDLCRQVEDGEPPGLHIGDVHLEDGRTVSGVLYEMRLAEGHHKDISSFGGWRRYVESMASESVAAG